MSQVLFLGGSAGGHLAGQFVNIQTNPDYAELMGVSPVLEKENIKAVIFNSALLDNERFSSTGDVFFDWTFLQCGRAYFDVGFLQGHDNVMQSNVIDNVTSNFPPSYISDGNTGTFDAQARDLCKKLDSLGVMNHVNLHEKSEVVLGHGFESDGSEWAEDNMRQQLAFIDAILK